MKSLLSISRVKVGPNKTKVKGLEERLASLDSLFATLEKLPQYSSSRSDFPYDKFDRKRCQKIIAHAFLRHVGERQHVEEPTLESLRRRAKLILKLLKEAPPAFVSQPLLEWFNDLLTEICWQKSIRKRYSRRSCPFVKRLADDLITYFGQVRTLRSRYAKQSELYKLAGQILEELSRPKCLVCGQFHRYKRNALLGVDPRKGDPEKRIEQQRKTENDAVDSSHPAFRRLRSVK